MKTLVKTILIVAVLAMAFSCGEDDAPQPPIVQPDPDNQEPAAPQNPSPAHEETIDEFFNVTLQWEGSDPDGDALTYDLLLGEDVTDLELIGESLTESSFVVERLETDVTYFWRITAIDDEGASATSSIFSFSIGELVFEGSISLTSQEEVNDFGAQGFTRITGNLLVGLGGSKSTVNDLTSLQNLNKIDGGMTIINTLLTDLQGLQNLVRINEHVTIHRNDALETLSGLENLVFSQEVIFAIMENPSLKNLGTLNGLTVAEVITITSNEQLTSLQGIQGLKQVGSLRIAGNDRLENQPGTFPNALVTRLLIIFLNPSLSSLDGLKVAGSMERVSITDSPELTSISMLQGLTTVGTINIRQTGLTNFGGLENVIAVGSITLEDNNALSNLQGLESLTSTADFFIHRNESLIDLTGLDNLVSTGAFRIQENNSLVGLKGLENLREVNGFFGVSDNPGLRDLCALQEFAAQGGFDPNDFLTAQNAYNPDLTDIENGNCVKN